MLSHNAAVLDTEKYIPGNIRVACSSIRPHSSRQGFNCAKVLHSRYQRVPTRYYYEHFVIKIMSDKEDKQLISTYKCK